MKSCYCDFFKGWSLKKRIAFMKEADRFYKTKNGDKK